METLTLFLGLSAACIHVAGYLLYNIQTKLGQSKPNGATWIVWVLLAGGNALTYNASTGSFVTGLQFFAGSVACFVTFLYVLCIGRITWPKKREWFCTSLAIVGGIVWLVFHKASYANLIIVAAFAFSFQPTFSGVWRDPFTEKPLSWLLWTLSCVITTVSVALNKRPAIAFVAPVSLAILHGVVVFLCSGARKKRFSGRVSA